MVQRGVCSQVAVHLRLGRLRHPGHGTRQASTLTFALLVVSFALLIIWVRLFAFSVYCRLGKIVNDPHETFVLGPCFCVLQLDNHVLFVQALCGVT